MRFVSIGRVVTRIIHERFGFEGADLDIGAVEFGTPRFADGSETGDLSGWTITAW